MQIGFRAEPARQVVILLGNGRKLPALSGLLRNSTIFRVAKNWDSDSAPVCRTSRKLPERAGSLSNGPIVPEKDNNLPGLRPSG